MNGKECWRVNILSIQELRKSFGNFEAVKGVSFSVEKGESFSLLGPNGAGKSTIINMMTGLYPPTLGSIEINGIAIDTLQKTGHVIQIRFVKNI